MEPKSQLMDIKKSSIQNIQDIEDQEAELDELCEEEIII